MTPLGAATSEGNGRGPFPCDLRLVRFVKFALRGPKPKARTHPKNGAPGQSETSSHGAQ